MGLSKKNGRKSKQYVCSECGGPMKKLMTRCWFVQNAAIP